MHAANKSPPKYCFATLKLKADCHLRDSTTLIIDYLLLLFDQESEEMESIRGSSVRIAVSISNDEAPLREGILKAMVYSSQVVAIQF